MLKTLRIFLTDYHTKKPSKTTYMYIVDGFFESLKVHEDDF